MIQPRDIARWGIKNPASWGLIGSGEGPPPPPPPPGQRGVYMGAVSWGFMGGSGGGSTQIIDGMEITVVDSAPLIVELHDG